MVEIHVGSTQSPLAQVLGVLGGLGQGFDALKQEQAKRDLDTLKLFAANDRYELGPAPEAPAVPFSERLLSGARYQKTAEGFPVIDVGGQPFTIRTRPQLDLDTLARRAVGETPSVVGSPTPPSAPSLTPAGEVIPPSSPLYAGPPITQGPLTPAGTDGTPSTPPRQWRGAAAEGLPPMPTQLSMVVTPQDLSQHAPIRAAIDIYNEKPTSANLAAVRKAYAEAPDAIRKERIAQYQLQLETYRAAVQRREAERAEARFQREQQQPKYGFGEQLDSIIYSLHGEELGPTGTPKPWMVKEARELAKQGEVVTNEYGTFLIDKQTGTARPVVMAPGQPGGAGAAPSAAPAAAGGGGTGTPAPAGTLAPGQPLPGKPMTESQARAYGFGSRAAQGNALVEALEAQGETGTSFAPYIAGQLDKIGAAVGGTAGGIVGLVVGNLPGAGVGATMGGGAGYAVGTVLADPLANLLRTPAEQQYYQAKMDFIGAILRKESGAAISASEFRQEDRHYFPQPGDAAAVIQQKAVARTQALKMLELEAGRPLAPPQPVPLAGQAPTGVPGRVPPYASDGGPLDAARGLGNAVAPGLQRLESDLAEDLRPALDRRRGAPPAPPAAAVPADHWRAAQVAELEDLLRQAQAKGDPRRIADIQSELAAARARLGTTPPGPQSQALPPPAAPPLLGIPGPPPPPTSHSTPEQDAAYRAWAQQQRPGAQPVQAQFSRTLAPAVAQTDVKPFIVMAARQLGLDPVLALSLARQESNFNPSATSPTNVQGLYQVTNATGARYGQTPATRTDYVTSTLAGLRLLKDLLQQNGGDVRAALAHYGDPNEKDFPEKVLRHYPAMQAALTRELTRVAQGNSSAPQLVRQSRAS
jgi:hypothetical protein